MHPMSRLECAAHTILAMMDVLSTVFRTREHAAHVRVVGPRSRSKRAGTVVPGCPL
jgi:hypothetical protein